MHLFSCVSCSSTGETGAICFCHLKQVGILGTELQVGQIQPAPSCGFFYNRFSKMATSVKLERVSYTRGLTVSQSEFGDSGRQLSLTSRKKMLIFLLPKPCGAKGLGETQVLQLNGLFFFPLADGTGISLETLVLESMRRCLVRDRY